MYEPKSRRITRLATVRFKPTPPAFMLTSFFVRIRVLKNNCGEMRLTKHDGDIFVVLEFLNGVIPLAKTHTSSEAINKRV